MKVSMYGADECPVCLEETSCDDRTFLLPCRHTVCAACTARLHAACVDRCPLCREQIMGVDVAAIDEEDGDDVLEFSVGHGVHAGITLTNLDASSSGVRVVALMEHDAAFAANLHVGDIITHVNGIPATQHRRVVDIINASTRHALPVRLRRRGAPEPPTAFSAARCLAGCLRRGARRRQRGGSEEWERMFRERGEWVRGHANSGGAP